MSTLDDPTTERGTHPVNTGHLVMGLAFLGICGVWLAVQADWASTDDVGWLLPLPWVFAGAAGLIVLAVAGRRSARRTETYPAYVEPDPTYDDTAADPEEIR